MNFTPRALIVSQKHNGIFCPAEIKQRAAVPITDRLPSANLDEIGVIFNEGNNWMPIYFWSYGIILVSDEIRIQMMRETVLIDRFRRAQILSIESTKLSKQSPPNYWWFYPANRVSTATQSVRIQGGLWKGKELDRKIITNTINPWHLSWTPEDPTTQLCSPLIVYLARKYKWPSLYFRPLDLSDYEVPFEIDYLGKQWPPQWWPEGYEPHPSNVIEAEVPDVKVGEGLVGEFAPTESPKPKRKAARADGPLITPATIRGLKLEESDYGFEGEVSLSRPLYGADTLSVSISLEGDDMDEDGPRIKKSLLKTKTQAALARLESLLPQIHARLLEEGRPYAPTPEAFLETVHDPALLLTAADFTQGEKWSFVVESDIVGFHFEFDGDTLIDVWSGD